MSRAFYNTQKALLFYGLKFGGPVGGRIGGGGATGRCIGGMGPANIGGIGRGEKPNGGGGGGGEIYRQSSSYLVSQ